MAFFEQDRQKTLFSTNLHLGGQRRRLRVVAAFHNLRGCEIVPPPEENGNFTRNQRGGSGHYYFAFFFVTVFYIIDHFPTK